MWIYVSLCESNHKPTLRAWPFLFDKQIIACLAVKPKNHVLHFNQTKPKEIHTKHLRQYENYKHKGDTWNQDKRGESWIVFLFLSDCNISQPK